MGSKLFFPKVLWLCMSINRTDALGRYVKVNSRFHSTHNEFLYLFVTNTVQDTIYYFWFWLTIMSLFLFLLPFSMLLSTHFQWCQKMAGGRKKGLKRIGWNNLSEGVLPECTVILFSSRNSKTSLSESFVSWEKEVFLSWLVRAGLCLTPDHPSS